jgi:hypothetical protein
MPPLVSCIRLFYGRARESLLDLNVCELDKERATRPEEDLMSQETVPRIAELVITPVPETATFEREEALVIKVVDTSSPHATVRQCPEQTVRRFQYREGDDHREIGSGYPWRHRPVGWCWSATVNHADVYQLTVMDIRVSEEAKDSWRQSGPEGLQLAPVEDERIVLRRRGNPVRLLP